MTEIDINYRTAAEITRDRMRLYKDLNRNDIKPPSPWNLVLLIAVFIIFFLIAYFR